MAFQYIKKQHVLFIISFFLLASCASTQTKTTRLSPYQEKNLAMNGHFQNLNFNSRPSQYTLSRQDDTQYFLIKKGGRSAGQIIHESNIDFPKGFYSRFLAHVRLIYASSPFDKRVDKRDYFGAFILFRDTAKEKPLKGFSGEPFGVIGLMSGADITPNEDDIPPMLVYKSKEKNIFLLVNQNRISGIVVQADKRIWGNVAGWMPWHDYKARLQWIAKDNELTSQLGIAFQPLENNDRISDIKALHNEIKAVFAKDANKLWDDSEADIVAWKKALAMAKDPVSVYKVLMDQDKLIARFTGDKGNIPAGAIAWRKANVKAWPKRLAQLLGESIEHPTVKRAIDISLRQDIKTAIQHLDETNRLMKIRSNDIWLQSSMRLKSVLDAKPQRHNPTRDIREFHWKERVSNLLRDISVELLTRWKLQAGYNIFNPKWPSGKRWASHISWELKTTVKYPQYWQGMLLTLQNIQKIEHYLNLPLKKTSLNKEIKAIKVLISAEKRLRTTNPGKLIVSDVAQRLRSLSNGYLSSSDARKAKKLAQQLLASGSLKPAGTFSTQ